MDFAEGARGESCAKVFDFDVSYCKQLPGPPEERKRPLLEHLVEKVADGASCLLYLFCLYGAILGCI